MLYKRDENTEVFQKGYGKAAAKIYQQSNIWIPNA
jgi:hypothetical protein